MTEFCTKVAYYCTAGYRTCSSFVKVKFPNLCAVFTDIDFRKLVVITYKTDIVNVNLCAWGHGIREVESDKADTVIVEVYITACCRNIKSKPSAVYNTFGEECIIVVGIWLEVCSPFIAGCTPVDKCRNRVCRIKSFCIAVRNRKRLWLSTCASESDSCPYVCYNACRNILGRIIEGACWKGQINLSVPNTCIAFFCSKTYCEITVLYRNGLISSSCLNVVAVRKNTVIEFVAEVFEEFIVFPNSIESCVFTCCTDEFGFSENRAACSSWKTEKVLVAYVNSELCENIACCCFGISIHCNYCCRCVFAIINSQGILVCGKEADIVNIHACTVGHGIRSIESHAACTVGHTCICVNINGIPLIVLKRTVESSSPAGSCKVRTECSIPLGNMQTGLEARIAKSLRAIWRGCIRTFSQAMESHSYGKLINSTGREIFTWVRSKLII